MILCRYEELRAYQPLLPKLEHALDCVEKLRKEGFPSGRYEYEGGFLFVQRGSTKPFDENSYETHRRYIDVQYMVEGGELAYYEPVSGLSEYGSYDEAGDIAFFSSQEHKGSILKVAPGMCWVAYPADAHMPCRCCGHSSEYLKIVMKLPCE